MVDNFYLKHFCKMFLVQLVILSAFAVIVTKEDWVEIPQVKSFVSSTKVSGTFFSDIKTPMNVVLHEEQVENLEAFNTTESPEINKRISTEDTTFQNNNRIGIKPAKSSIMEVFSSSTSTTEFTPLMSSISVGMTSPVTTPMPTTRTTESRNLKKNKGKKKNKQNNHSDGIEIEDGEDDNIMNNDTENRQVPEENNFSTYTEFMPFIRSIQSTLLQRAHKTVKSKIQILKNLKDSLLYEIDQRIKRLWGTEETSAREYKEDHHIEFPSNEGALMTIGFLTLAVFLVKLVLQVIAEIKAKKAYYNTTTTTAATAGRKRRSVPDEGLDEETTYRILNLIDTYKINNFDYN